MNASTDRLKDDLRHVATDIEELLKVSAGEGGERIAQARDRLQTVLRNARSELDELGGVAVERARRAARDTDKYVQTCLDISGRGGGRRRADWLYPRPALGRPAGGSDANPRLAQERGRDPD